MSRNAGDGVQQLAVSNYIEAVNQEWVAEYTWSNMIND